jgi:L-amino acid N-acyltransferase YncA
MGLTIEAMKPADWPRVRAIYREGIATGNATFEIAVPDWANWEKAHRPDCRLVARLDREIIGWAALSPVSSRCVYGGVGEVSVYLAESVRGQGIGKALLTALIEESEKAGFWTLQAGIFPENVVSIALHRSCGFREVGRRERIGKMNGVWRDTVLMERRSTTVGV